MYWLRNKLLFNSIYYIIPLLAFPVIWVPIISHHHVSNIVITDKMIDAARRFPADSVLDELNQKKFSYGLNISWESDKQLIIAAEKILNGKVEIPGLPYTSVNVPFNADDIDKGLPVWQLHFSGFTIPKALLSAYELTGRNEFLTTARDIILAWALYERNAWLPRGLLWNDHAVAARILVLSKFWRIYRNHQDYQPETAKNILQLVARSGKLLSKPSHFTFATNHGIMQNLALWHLSLSFPTVPNVEQYKQLALERMHDQMVFYVNNEGVILEHSAGYQNYGLHLISMAFRYLTLLDLSIPEVWNSKYEKAKNVYGQLRRPDGSLPMFGDTGSGENSVGPPVTNLDVNGRSKILDFQKNWIPQQSNSLYPVAGYSIWWDGLDVWPDEQKLNQTVVAWSYFQGHGHKHADEMSVLLYAGGQTWWTNAGYWAYGTKGRSMAVSWSGSNAPHLIEESTNSVRNTKLKFHGWSDNLAVIDLERRGPQEYVVRRQVVHLKPYLWIVVDFTSGDKNSRTTTTWTTYPDVRLSEVKLPGSYYLKGENDRVSLTTFFISSEGTKIKSYRGSFTPFAGWVKNRPANAIVIEQPANNSWSVAIWSLENTVVPTLQFTGQPYMQNWKGPEEWKIVLPVETGLFSIWREGDGVYLNEGTGGDSTKEVKLIRAPDLTDKYAEISAGYENAVNKYPKFRGFSYRWKATYFLIFIFILQEVFFLIYKKVNGKHYAGLRVFNMLGWAGMMMWLVMVYFKA